MATPITFSPIIDWVDATDPNNIPNDVRIITASDLLRYELFGRDGAAAINDHEGSISRHTSEIADIQTKDTEQDTALGDLATWRTDATTDLTNLKKLRALATKTTSYTVTAADSVIIGNGTSITVTLMSAATATPGRVFTVKNKAATALTVASAGGSIDGATSAPLAQWEAGSYISDGTNWFTI